MTFLPHSLINFQASSAIITAFSPKESSFLPAEVKPGKSWEKESKRAGKLKFSESVTEYRNQDGELIITATSVGVVTEKPVEN